MQQLYPLKFRNIFKAAVWGGEKIASFKGVSEERKNIGESWELSCVRGEESVVSEGPLAGSSIRDLMRMYKGMLVGTKAYEETGDEFPLLIKFIDAKSDLSIQVHPDDELASLRHGGSMGKTEMWYVISADEGAHLMSGLKESITPDEYAAKVAENTVTDILCDYSVKSGDVFFLPAGRIHSIGAGCFIAEIQQTSDITYRIYDFGRAGLDGKPRELHTELSRDAIDYKVLGDYRTYYDLVQDSESLLVNCRYFTTFLYELNSPFKKDMSDIDSFMILICIGGSGFLRDDKGNEVSLRQGETVLLPADTVSFTLIPNQSMKLLASHME